jgi:hypothetical protein
MVTDALAIFFGERRVKPRRPAVHEFARSVSEPCVAVEKSYTCRDYTGLRGA